MGELQLQYKDKHLENKSWIDLEKLQVYSPLESLSPSVMGFSARLIVPRMSSLLVSGP